MSNEFKVSYNGSGTPTIVGLLENAGGQFYNTASSAFEAYTAANVANYAAVIMAQVGNTPEYMGSVPAGIAAGKYRAAFYKRAAAALAVSDLVAASLVGSGDTEWTGTAEISLAVSQAAQSTAIAGVPAAVWASGARTLTTTEFLSTAEQNALTAAAAGTAPTASAVATAVWGFNARTITGGTVSLPADFLSSAEQNLLANTATASSVAALSTAVSGLAAATVTAMKADSQLAKTFMRTLGKFTYNTQTGVMTELLDDAATVIGTNTITQSSGVITSRV